MTQSRRPESADHDDAVARDVLLARLRGALDGRDRVAAPPAFAPPDEPATWAQFAAALAEGRGEARAPVARSVLRETLADVTGSVEVHCAHGAASLLDEEPAPSAAREIAGLPWLVASGRMAVARSGAVAVTHEEVPVRLHLLLPERLVLLVPAEALVMDLPGLYVAIDPGTLAGGYLTLVAGPSRTADIEQTLVTGAHGPRELVVLPWAD